ncbi:MAG: AAA family ATPase [Thermoleophilia bacterium]|nr:AAA family ATPase [Thermoleophilia bacterium]GIK77702.1 MAG: transcriptional regulator [Actinomycetes bacterium]
MGRASTALIGREREGAEIERLLESAVEGSSGTLVVRGEAGIGKSALLEHAAEHAAEMLVLRAIGVEAESDLAFAGCHGLVRPILGSLPELPEPQSEALQGALGLGPSTGADRFLIAAALLSLLAAAAEERPVLCLVDDAQWLDAPSAEALVFVARRLRAEPVAILFAARDGEPRRFEAAGLPELVVTGLDDESAAALLADRATEAAAAIRARLLAEAEGNPLALLELPAALSGEQLAGRAPLPEAMPLTPRLRSLFRERIGRLPEPTRAALQIAAADSGGDLPTVLRAAAEIGLPGDALDAAEREGLVRTAGGAIAFRHPLVRSAVHVDATVGQRQRVHAALASVLAGEENTDRRVWHQAMATVSGDEEVAASLEASARRAQLRAGHASAATALERAAELTVDEARRSARLAAAAQAGWDAGQPDRALMLIARVLPSADRDLRSKLLHLRGVIELRCGNKRDAITTLLEGAELSSDPALTLEMLHEAAEAATHTGDLPAAGGFNDSVAGLPTPTRRARFNQLTMAGFGKLFCGDDRSARIAFESALDLAGELDDDPRAQLWASNIAMGGFDPGVGLPYSTRAVALARSQGLLSVLPVALERHALNLFWSGQLDLAYAAAEEGYQLAAGAGHGGWHLATMASVEAVRGREADAREHAAQVLALAHASGEAVLASLGHSALGLLELTIGRPERAADQLLELVADSRPGSNPIVAVINVPEAVEAVVRAGRPVELIAAPLDRYRTLVLDAPTDARRSLLARCEALAGPGPPEEAFSDAAASAGSLPPFQRARGELLHGEWLRRERRRQEARGHLRAALELFRQVGAAPWEERAEAELRATGETARKRDPSTLDELTPQELQIAGLVSQGMTNREVAAQLFLSPRTIDYHLRKVFSKLGIASRTELAREDLLQRNAA